ncbi:MAG: hypothetical protein P4L99_13660, partial [Chthoniobacter sp.]|nr:hypothetical protein [Chthoniobacter sp.]
MQEKSSCAAGAPRTVILSLRRTSNRLPCFTHAAEDGSKLAPSIMRQMPERRSEILRKLSNCLGFQVGMRVVVGVEMFLGKRVWRAMA